MKNMGKAAERCAGMVGLCALGLVPIFAVPVIPEYYLEDDATSNRIAVAGFVIGLGCAVLCRSTIWGRILRWAIFVLLLASVLFPRLRT
jgi:hypothetical protein